jgi:Cdc6-like AAA superfamily ATPase
LEEPKYPLIDFLNDISNVITKRYSSEGIDFKDYTQDQLAIRLEYDLSKLANIIRENNYPDNKNKLIDVATDIYYLTSQIVYGEKYGGKI